jgi:tRNA dimethylallyltransferase
VCHYGVISSGEVCDAQLFCNLAKPVITEIAGRGKLPIVVGGSGLYVKSLTHGLSPLPSDAALRQKLEHLTPEERIAWLLVRDPQAEETVNLKNDRYVTRALEICLLTGRRQSELRQAWSKAQVSFRGVRLAWERPVLDARINQRVLDMIEVGLVEEVRDCADLSSTAAKAIGVQEVRRHLSGEASLADTIAAIQLATRQYARRQEKWFRRERAFPVLAMDEDTPINAVCDRAMAEVALRETP